MPLDWLPNPDPASFAVQCSVGHGEWWVCPFPSGVIELRYGQARTDGFSPIVMPVARFASVEEAMLAAELYEEACIPASAGSAALSDADFRPYVGAILQRKQGRGVDWLLKITDSEVGLSGSARKDFHVGNINSAALRRAGIGNQAADIVVCLEIVSARLTAMMNGHPPSRPLDADALTRWRDARQPVAPGAGMTS